MSHEPQPSTGYASLLVRLSGLLEQGRQQAARMVNTVLLRTYFEMGRHIVEFEQGGKERAEYGSALIDRLSFDLTTTHGKGFSRSNVFQIRQFYLRFSKIQTLFGQSDTGGLLDGRLSWSHCLEVMKAESDLEASFYVRQCEQENWSVRELKRQMQSMLFHRIALSKDKEGVLALAQRGQEIAQPSDIIKDPFVLEFLNIPQSHRYLEGDLEERIITNLRDFLLELGSGFAFIGRQYRLSIGTKKFYVDLVFYHRILKCFVLIDLKRGEIEHGDIGQMNLYLNYFRREENTEGDNDPIGIVLGAFKDQILVEYATEHIGNQLFVSKYQLHLPDKKRLALELEKLLDDTH